MPVITALTGPSLTLAITLARQCTVTDLWLITTLPSRHRFIWLIGERDAPYAVIAYQPNFETMQKGYEKFSEAMQLINECMQTNDWHGYPTDILDINLPAWA